MGKGEAVFLEMTEVEELLKKGEDATIDDFGTFSICDNSSGKSIVFTPSEDLLGRLDNGPKCPKCHSRNVVNFDEDFGAYVCEECETEWEEQI